MTQPLIASARLEPLPHGEIPSTNQHRNQAKMPFSGRSFTLCSADWLPEARNNSRSFILSSQTLGSSRHLKSSVALLNAPKATQGRAKVLKQLKTKSQGVQVPFRTMVPSTIEEYIVFGTRNRKHWVCFDPLGVASF